MNSDKKFPVHAEIVVNLTMQDIDDIMCLALEGGITYWCCEAEVVGEYLGEYAHEQISRNGTLLLHYSEEDKEYQFTLEHFVQGFRLYLEQGCHIAVEDSAIDTGDLDANDADCIVQFGLFGEVLYGLVRCPV